MDITGIQAHVAAGQFTFTDHALQRMIRRDISDTEVIEAILAGEIIEEYPDDKYSPSCLIYGQTKAGRHIHVQCCLPPRVKVITTYDPDPEE